METIYVNIADRSQLVRLGLISVLVRLNYSLNIHETASVDKLNLALRKEHKSLLIVSNSFLNNCPLEIFSLISARHKQLHIVLIKDAEAGINRISDFNDIIDFDDVEKTIYNKLEKQIQEIWKPSEISRITDEISTREKEVLKLVALGMTNKEIAEKLFISSHTVITHRKNITAKLGIKTIAGLTVYAIINKLITAEEIN